MTGHVIRKDLQPVKTGSIYLQEEISFTRYVSDEPRAWLLTNL